MSAGASYPSQMFYSVGSQLMQYFYLKIGHRNCLAEDWLSGKNPIGLPAGVIFFGKCTIEQIKAEDYKVRQVKDFYLSSLPENRGNTIIAVIGHGKGWIIQPSGILQEYHPTPADKHNLDDYWKILPVKILKSFSLKEIPPVLAGINANAYLGRGTYREIPYGGNIKAIASVLALPLPNNYLTKENITANCLLECLSSVELETLVAKLFEDKGCFVPAYRGGYLQDIDLFVHNYQNISANVGGIDIPPQCKISMQVKGHNNLTKCPEEVDYFIGLNAPNSDNCFDGEWLLNQIRQSPAVAKWLRLSLSWLPEEIISSYGL